MQVGYYELFRYNPWTSKYDIWLGSATREVAERIGAQLGGFLGYEKPTADGWACKAKK